MSTELERRSVMHVPPWAMAETLLVARELRSAHRKNGGKSKLIRDGDRLTLSFAGPPDAVLDMAQVVEQMRRQLERVVALRAFAERLEAAVREEKGAGAPGPEGGEMESPGAPAK